MRKQIAKIYTTPKDVGAYAIEVQKKGVQKIEQIKTIHLKHSGEVVDIKRGGRRRAAKRVLRRANALPVRATAFTQLKEPSRNKEVANTYWRALIRRARGREILNHRGTGTQRRNLLEFQ